MKIKLLKKCRKYITIQKNIDSIFKFAIVSHFNGYDLSVVCRNKSEAKHLLRINQIQFAYWYFKLNQ